MIDGGPPGAGRPARVRVLSQDCLLGTPNTTIVVGTGLRAPAASGAPRGQVERFSWGWTHLAGWLLDVVEGTA